MLSGLAWLGRPGRPSLANGAEAGCGLASPPGWPQLGWPSKLARLGQPGQAGLAQRGWLAQPARGNPQSLELEGPWGCHWPPTKNAPSTATKNCHEQINGRFPETFVENGSDIFRGIFREVFRDFS